MHATNTPLKILLLAVLASGLLGCVIKGHSAQTPKPLDWLTGCWQLDDGSVEETWTRSIHGDQLFGFSVNTQGSQRVFFEQLRIDINEPEMTLSAYPKGIGPTEFSGFPEKTQFIEFINKDNDYPQRIRYERVGNRLAAQISLFDRTQPANWDYRRCDERR